VSGVPGTLHLDSRPAHEASYDGAETGRAVPTDTSRENVSDFWFRGLPLPYAFENLQQYNHSAGQLRNDTL